MNVDTSHPKRVVLQPETAPEQAILHTMQDRLKGQTAGPRGEQGAIQAYFTAGIPEYPALDTALFEAAESFRDVGFRALVLSWRT